MILLTGATGYLGSQIAAELVRRGKPFRLLVRDASRLGFDTAGKCEIALGDLRDADRVTVALGGVKQVIHSAALVKMWARNPQDFRFVNVEGLKNLLLAAEKARVERVVYTSSFLALGPSPDASASETLEHRGPYSNDYEQSKADALAWLRADGFAKFPVVALMPGVIYGPGPATEGNLVGGMIQQYLAGKFPGLLGSGEQRWSFAFNADVVAAHLAALEKGRPGEAYVLGGDNRSLNDFFKVLSELTGVRRSVRHLPFAVGKAIGAVEMVRARSFGHSPKITPGVVEVFRHDWVYSSAKAAAELGYHITPLEQGLARTLAAGSGKTKPPTDRAIHE
jgi:NAD+-dependent farnesol dehydrogenase